MKRFRVPVLAALFSAALLSASTAHADGVTITVTPWLAPNAYGSPSYSQAVSNAVYAQMNGLSSYGSAGPTQFNAQSNATSSQVIVTGFSSWMGVADPGGAYANELGNRMTFGLAVVGDGKTMFSISQLSFSSVASTDSLFPPDNQLGFSFGEGSYSYGGANNDYVGVLYGADGKLGGGDDTYYYGPDSTMMVNAIFGRGSGDSYAAYCDDVAPCDNQADSQKNINAAAAYPNAYTFTGTYTLDLGNGNSTSGSGTFNITPDVAATPEPSSIVLLGTGLVGAFGAARRKFRKA